MSDALTDISRDEARAKISKKIYDLESDFSADPIKEKAVELIELWRQLLLSPKGYSSSPNTWFAYERIGMYKMYLESGEIPNLRLSNKATINTKRAEIFLRYGNGFIMEDSLGDWISSAIYENTGKMPRYRNFKVKLTLEEVEEVTCMNCPCFNGYCGSIECRSINPEELDERKDIASYGKKLTNDI